MDVELGKALLSVLMFFLQKGAELKFDQRQTDALLGGMRAGATLKVRATISVYITKGLALCECREVSKFIFGR